MSNPAATCPVRRFVRAPADERDAGELESGFVRHQRLADLLFRRRLSRVGQGLVESNGVRYELHEAVRVLDRRGAEGRREDDGRPELTGVQRLTSLLARGAELVGDELVVAGVRYRIERGVLALARPLAS